MFPLPEIYIMSLKHKLKVGSKIVECGEVYRVFKIEKREQNGNSEKIIHYKACFINSTNETVVCSIPANSLGEVNIRVPVTKEELEGLLEGLSKRPNRSYEVDEAKPILGLNDAHKTASVLRCYWREKNKNSETFSKAKKDVLGIAISRTIEEVAAVSGVSLKKAEDVLNLALDGK